MDFTCIGGCSSDKKVPIFTLLFALVIPAFPLTADDSTTLGDRMIAEYFRNETIKLQENCLADIETADQWKNNRSTYRRQLLEMLGLYPTPERSPLKAEITGKVQHEEFTVEKLHFQSMPHLYVTANLYIPKNATEPLPAVLYVCGHAKTIIDGVSYGNKVNYQHHPAWFARNGFVCLIIDTLQWSEITGMHHGIFSHDKWWWNCRGYTPAGVEAWNCVRALDYLQSRPEVDPSRLGVTGRSGGGAYSWWIAAIDPRIKAAVPTAGITDLENYIVKGIPTGRYPNGCIEGHCDCMFPVNTYRWDMPMVSALVAPRALLIANSDKDDLFPINGIFRLYQKTMKIYRLCDAERNLGINITEGSHGDTQQLRVHAFAWFNRFLKNKNPLISDQAVKFFEPQQLKVFDELPEDQINTKISETFVPKADPPQLPVNTDQWQKMRNNWLDKLNRKCFRSWPDLNNVAPLDICQKFSADAEGINLTALRYTSQHDIRLPLYIVKPADLDHPEKLTVKVLTQPQWEKWLAVMNYAFANQLPASQAEPNLVEFQAFAQRIKGTRQAIAYVPTRGIGPTRWTDDSRKRVHIRRRFMLLGQTLDSMRIWDLTRAMQAIRTLGEYRTIPTSLQGHKTMAGIALYASLYEPGIDRIDLYDPPTSHRDGPIVLNVLKYLDLPAVVAMAAERSAIRIYQSDKKYWQYPADVVKQLDWSQQRFGVVNAD